MKLFLKNSRQPPLSSVANIFVLPLSTDVWICIFILLLVIFVAMLFQLVHPALKRLFITRFDVATFIWGAVCQQGTHLLIPTTSGRFVVVTTFLGFIFNEMFLISFILLSTTRPNVFF